MPVFKTFLKIALKNLPSGIIYFVLFMGLSFLIANINLNNKEFEMSSFTIGIEDNDNSEISNALVAYLGNTHEIVDIPESKDELINQLYYREINYTISIPKGYGESVINNGDLLLTYSDINGTSSSYYISQQIQQYLKSISAYMVAGKDLTLAIEATNKAMENSTQVEMVEQNNKYDKSYFYFRQMSYVLICIIFMVIAPAILVFNNKEIHNRNECSIFSTIKIKMQIILGGILFSLSVWAICIICTIVYNGGLSDNFWLCVINSLIYLLVIVAIVMLVTSFNINKNAIVMATNVIGLGMSFLGGVFVPLQFLGEGIKSISKFLPTYWYIVAIEEIYFGSNKNQMFFALGIQILFAVALILLALLVTKLHRQNRTA